MIFFSKIIFYFEKNLWDQKKWYNYILLPISKFFSFILNIRYYFFQNYVKSNCFVISVGNRIMGGGGKTPIIITLVYFLKKSYSIAIVASGYSGNLISKEIPLLVDCTRHNYLDVGDEAIMLAKFAPTFVCKKKKMLYL